MSQTDETTGLATSTASHLAFIEVSNAHEAVSWLLVSCLVDMSGQQWRFPAVPTESGSMKLAISIQHSRGDCTLNLVFIPLFASLRIHATINLNSENSSNASPGAVPSAASPSATTAEPVLLPPLTIKDVNAILPPASFNSGKQPFSSFSRDHLRKAVSSIEQLLTDSSLNWLSTLQSTGEGLRKSSVEEQLFQAFIDSVCQQTSQLQSVQAASASLASTTTTVTASPLLPPLTSPFTLNFPAEKVITPQSAFVSLIHLLLSYEGFRSVDTQALLSTLNASSSSQKFLPSHWEKWTSNETVYAWIVQHLSLVTFLPYHAIHVKCAMLFDGVSVVHIQLEADIRSNKKYRPVQSDSQNGEAMEISESQASNEPSKIYTIKLRNSDFIPPTMLGSTTVSGDTDANLPHHLYKHLAKLLSQFRNRVFKHMLGEEYRLNNANSSKAASATGATTAMSSSSRMRKQKPCFIIRMPQEILLGIFHFLPSQELIQMSNTNWTFSYICSHPFLWQQLYLREIPVGTVESGSSGGDEPAEDKEEAEQVELALQTSKFSPHSDWKTLFLARLLKVQKWRQQQALEAARLREQQEAMRRHMEESQNWLVPFSPESNHPTIPLFNPFPQSYHPTPFHNPEAPTFYLPGARRV